MDSFTVKVLQYAKGLAVSIGSVITALVVGIPAITGGPVPVWLAILALVVTAVAVIAIPNAPTQQQTDEVVKKLAEQGALKESVTVEVPTPGLDI